MFVVLLRRVRVHACAADAWHASRLEATCASLIAPPFDAVQDVCASATMATTSETMLNSTHAFKAVVVKQGLEHVWDCFETMRITTWSAMGLVLGFFPTRVVELALAEVGGAGSAPAVSFDCGRQRERSLHHGEAPSPGPTG